MQTNGTIFALDLAMRTGWAIGSAGARPSSGTVVLKKPSEHRSVAFSNLIAWLQEQWAEQKPAFVIKEAMLPLQAFRTLGNAAYTVQMTAGLHATVEGMCVRYGIPFRDISDKTVRKHFTGQANWGDRQSTKCAVIQRCHTLGYIPKDCADDNRADALATWDYAAHTVAGYSPEKLRLFGEAA